MRVAPSGEETFELAHFDRWLGFLSVVDADPTPDLDLRVDLFVR